MELTQVLTQLKEKKTLVIVGIVILFLLVLVLALSGKPSAIPPTPPTLP